MSIIIGLTGQSGAGKSTVSRVWARDSEFYIIDCDSLTKRIQQPGTECSREMARLFPEFYDNGVLDRRRAAAKLFSDRALLDSYNAAIFPFITKEIKLEAADAVKNGCKYIVLDAPTLFEAGADKLCDVIVSCVADEEVRLRRITERDGITPEQALRRFSSQHDERFFRSRSDHIIENNSSIEDAEQAAAQAAERIKESINGKKEKE